MKHKGNKNLTEFQRKTIERMLNEKKSRKEICTTLNIHKSTLSREIKKGLYQHKKIIPNFWKGNKVVFETRYSSDLAQDRTEMLSLNKGRDLKIGKDFALVHYIEKRVKEDKISACAVLGEIKRKKLPYTNISKTTLYRYIELGFLGSVRLEKRKKTYRKQVIKRVAKGTSIEQRPQEIADRTTFGHWEGDCVCGSTKATLFVMTERLTRQEIIFKMDRQTQKNVLSCIDTLERQYKDNFTKIFKSITFDNGGEFLDYKAIEKSQFGDYQRTQTYYCHPYSSYERGTNERLNREIRRLIPKGSNLSRYTTEDIQRVENWVNNYPREVLGFATSSELFAEHLKAIA